MMKSFLIERSIVHRKGHKNIVIVASWLKTTWKSCRKQRICPKNKLHKKETSLKTQAET